MVDAINPLGTDGFEFVEYTAANNEGIEQLKALFASSVLLKWQNIDLSKLGCIVKVTSTL